jgi:hypothetical protein
LKILEVPDNCGKKWQNIFVHDDVSRFTINSMKLIEDTKNIFPFD